MIKLLKTDDKHKTVSFCVLTPDIEDRNWDVITSEEIIKTADDFGANMQNKFLNIDHEDNTEIEKIKISVCRKLHSSKWYNSLRYNRKKMKLVCMNQVLGWITL